VRLNLATVCLREKQHELTFIQVGKLPENKDKMIVVIASSFGERYITSAMFHDEMEDAIYQPIEALEDPIDLKQLAQDLILFEYEGIDD
jgi:hypothetical protein